MRWMWKEEIRKVAHLEKYDFALRPSSQFRDACKKEVGINLHDFASTANDSLMIECQLFIDRKVSAITKDGEEFHQGYGSGQF